MLKTFISDFTENTYLISEKKETIIIDPGVKFNELSDYVSENDLHVKAILLTHGHVDHIFTLNECVDAFDCPVYIHENERDFLFDPNLNLSSTIYKKIVLQNKSKVVTYKDKDMIELPYNNLKVIYTPGHTRGSSCFLYKHFLFSGDTIFSDGVGRTDLPTGSQKKLTDSINMILNKLKDNTVIYPGHGTFTTVATQKDSCYLYRK
jgi:glyoxylase-like metal-dependent hydrolase (beta-lactamase superfamily II)